MIGVAFEVFDAAGLKRKHNESEEDYELRKKHQIRPSSIDIITYSLCHVGLFTGVYDKWFKISGILNHKHLKSLLTSSRQVDSSATTLWTGLFPKAGYLVSFLSSLCFIEIPVFNASSVDPDQMLHSAASDLGLHCLQITLLGVSQLK